MPINNIADQLTRDEGMRLKPYPDTVGKLTIGVGHNLTDKGITQQQAENLLWDDLREVSSEIIVFLPWAQQLDSARFGVLKNMAFNMGIQGLLGFHDMLTALKVSNYDGAAREMLASQWAKQVGDRAERLALQMRSGNWV